jgi:LacI family repressor for deo operon, udp, cdd, tsx, nupC, and nupG
MRAVDDARPARLKDVAALADVSLKTVTNVVHQRSNVKAETRERVLSAIAQLDYRPSLAGRALRNGRSNMITLAVPRIDEPYLGALAHALIAAATPRGYTVLIDETGGRPDQEQQAAEGYPGHGIDGVIFSPLALDPEHLAEMSHNVPMVLLGEHLVHSTADHVAIDNERSARDVVGHLVQTGRRRIGFLGGQASRPTAVGELRMQGYRAQLAESGIAPRAAWVAQSHRFTRDAGADRAMALINRSPSLDSMICASDLLAIGAMRALRRHGVRVPEDIAVTGWDNIVDGRYYLPSLTTVAPDLQRLAEQTLDALTSRIGGDRSAGRTYLVPHELIVRDSSGPKA